MPDFPADSAAKSPAGEAPVSATLLVYVLFAIAAVVGLVGHGMMVGAPLLTLSESSR